MKKLISLMLLLATPAITWAATNDTRPKADSSARNEVDARRNTVTPLDQLRGNKSDVEFTRRIRELIVGDSSLSMMAHNIKIVTINGVATLRGPVESKMERERIADLAKLVVREKQLRNKLEVKTKE